MSFSLPLSDLLRPISAAKPAGKNLRDHAVYDELRRARSADDTLDRGGWQRKLKLADWNRVTELATRALAANTKDLQIAAWLTEALARKHGLAGLREGLQLVTELLARFWDSLHPEIEDGDLDMRLGPLEWLNKILPEVIVQTPLTHSATGEGYTWRDRVEALRLDQLERSGKPEDQQTREALLADGKIESKKFEAAALSTPREFYGALAAGLRQSLEALMRLEEITDQRFGKDAPSFNQTKQALEDCAEWAEAVLQKKTPAVNEEPQAVAATEASAANDEMTVAPAADCETTHYVPASEVHLVLPEDLLALPQNWEEARQQISAIEHVLQNVLVHVETLRFAEHANGAAPSDMEKLWTQAEAHLQEGRFQSGLALLKNALRQARTERERFLLKLQLAEYCLLARKPALAKPLVEECLQKMETHRLDLWEAPELNVRVWQACHRCYQAAGENGAGGKERMELAFSRLCALDVEQALLHDNGNF